MKKTFCEFFAGIGLVRAGLEPSGWRCVYANDNDPKKVELYEKKFEKNGHFHTGDVNKANEVVRRIKGEPFLATASFPCIDLSLAGHYRGLNGEHSSAFFGFTRVLDKLGKRRPPLIQLENVVGFVTSNGGKDFACAAQTLARLGYWLDAFVVDSRHFVPQSRRRVFLVGVQSDLNPSLLVRRSRSELFDGWREVIDQAPKSFRPENLVNLMEAIRLRTGWAAFLLRAPQVTARTLKSLIDRDERQDWWDHAQVEKHYRMMSDRHRCEVDELKKTKRLHVGTIYRRVRARSAMAETRFDGTAGCLRTPRGGSARQIVILVGKGKLKMRWMSPREYARLQGADDFPLVDNVIQNLYGFGDAVCVPVIKWIDQQVLTPVYDHARQSQR